MGEFLPPKEVAARLGVSTRTVARLRAAGELEAVTLPGMGVRYRAGDLDDWILKQQRVLSCGGKLRDLVAVASLTSDLQSVSRGFGNCGGPSGMLLRVARVRAVSLAGRQTGAKPS